MSEDTTPVVDLLLSVRDGLVLLQGEMKSMQGEMKSMQGDMRSMQHEMKSLQEESTRLRVDMLGRFDRVEARLSDIRDDITVSMGRAEHAHDAAITTRDELRTEMQRVNAELRTITRKQRRLDARLDDLDKAP